MDKSSLSSSSLFETWVVDGPGRRREEAARGRDAVEQKNYNAQTLQELIRVLDHESLCTHSPSLADKGLLRPALDTPWVAECLRTLLSCEVQAIAPCSHLERELLSRAVLSALLLLRARQVETFRKEVYSLLRAEFGSRYQDLKFQCSTATVTDNFTKDKFRQTQTAFLLCAGNAHLMSINPAAPRAFVAFSRLGHFLFAGLPLVGLAAGGVGGVTLADVLKDLNHAFRPLFDTPDEQYTPLLSLQAFTTVAVASRLMAHAIASRTDLDYATRAVEAVESSLSLVRSLLTEILAKLPRVDNAKRSFPNFDMVLAAANWSPPDMDPYFYIYGLLDCATQLGRTLPNKEIPQDVRERMYDIIVKSGNESFRWKAVEFLLTNPGTRHEETQRIRKHCTKDQQSSICEIIAVISECFDEEEGNVIPHSSRSLSLSHSLTPSSGTNSQTEVSLSEWNETYFDSVVPTREAQRSIIKLHKGKHEEKRSCLSVGLSLDYGAAFFRTKYEIKIVKLHDKDSKVISCQDLCISNLDDAKVVLSSRFLAVLVSGYYRQVHERRTFFQKLFMNNQNEQYEQCLIVRDNPFSPSTSGLVIEKEFDGGWCADCLTIFEGDSCTRIAVGGHVSQHFTSWGSIIIFQIDNESSTPHKWTLSPRRLKIGCREMRSDFLRALSFCPKGHRLVGLTNNNCILSWKVPYTRAGADQNSTRAFRLPINYNRLPQETGAVGPTGIRPFYSPSHKPYVLCTTEPSYQRVYNNGEWSFIAPLGDGPAKVPPERIHSISGLREAGPILTGACSPDGKVIALVERSGKIFLFPLRARRPTGLSTPDKAVLLDKELAHQNDTAKVAVGFHIRREGSGETHGKSKAEDNTTTTVASSDSKFLYLYAVDIKGYLIQKKIGPVTSICPSPYASSRHTSISS